MSVVTRWRDYKHADPNTEVGAGEGSLYNPNRDNLGWSAALGRVGDSALQAGEGMGGFFQDGLDGVLGGVTDFIFENTGIDLSGPAGLFGQLLGLPLSFLGGTPLGAGLNMLGQFLPFLSDGTSSSGQAFDPVAAGGTFVERILNPTGLIGILTGGLFDPSMIPSPNFVSIGSLGAPRAIPMTAGTFGAGTIEGTGWDIDTTVTRSADGTGSARVVANGYLTAMRGVDIPVSKGQTLTPSIFVRWRDYLGSGVAARFDVVKFNGTTEVGIDTIATLSPSSASSGTAWSELRGKYPIPAGVTKVNVRPVMTDNAAAGTFWWDDGTYLLASNFASNLSTWFRLPTGIEDLFEAPDTFSPDSLVPVPVQNTIDSVVQAVRDIDRTGNLLEDLRDALRNFPNTNVTGEGGPSDIGGSVRETWNQWIGGLVGTEGEGAGLADLFNIGQMISSWSSKGRDSWDILGIRSNKPLWNGFLPTGKSAFPLTQVAFQAEPPTIDVTQGASTILWDRVEESADIRVISWVGIGNANLTGFYVNMWKMDPNSGDVTLLHHSPNVLSSVGAGRQTNLYTMPEAVHIEPGDVVGYELSPTGSGTHQVVGQQTWYDGHPTVYPKNFAATRNVGADGAAPATIASAAVVYSQKVPWIEAAISGGVVNDHDPVSVMFNQPGQEITTPIPAWANFIDRIPLGGGGGGHQGGTWGISGEGGDAGQWAEGTWERGVDFDDDDQFVHVTVGAGGSRGAPGDGGRGGDTIVSIPGKVSATAPGGAGGDTFTGGHEGDSPGNKTFRDVPYRGGGTQGSYGGSGAAPGGGGGGGNWISFQPGGAGAPGVCWLVFRQN